MFVKEYVEMRSLITRKCTCTGFCTLRLLYSIKNTIVICRFSIVFFSTAYAFNFMGYLSTKLVLKHKLIIA